MVIPLLISLVSLQTASYPYGSVLNLLEAEARKGFAGNEVTLTVDHSGEGYVICLSENSAVRTFSDVKLGDVLAINSFSKGLVSASIVGPARTRFRKTKLNLAKIDRVIHAVFADNKRRGMLASGFTMRVQSDSDGYSVMVTGLAKYVGGFTIYEVSSGFALTRVMPGH